MKFFAGLAAVAAAVALSGAPLAHAVEASAATKVAQAAPATPVPGAPAAAAPAAAAKARPPVPTRTEILNFDNWAVTCSEFAEGPSSRQCAALLRIVQQNTNQLVFAWTVTLDANKQAAAVLQTPTGVNLTPGVDLRIGKAPPHKIPFTSCEPNFCIAKAPLDTAILHEMVTNPTAEATLESTQGSDVKFNIQMKGFDRAFAALAR